MSLDPAVKLGKPPKSRRLLEALMKYRDARPKPKGWLLAVVDNIYKDGGWVRPSIVQHNTSWDSEKAW